MKIVVAVLFVSALSSSLAYDDTDPNKIDYATLSEDEINKNLDCFMDRGPCTDIQEHYKIHIRESVKNNCEKCSVFHKHNGHIFLRTLEKINPKGLEEFRKKYAPEPGRLETLETKLDAY